MSGKDAPKLAALSTVQPSPSPAAKEKGVSVRRSITWSNLHCSAVGPTITRSTQQLEGREFPPCNGNGWIPVEKREESGEEAVMRAYTTVPAANQEGLYV
ncbi:hypothetical protein VIGAN_06082900 [Vigna angularis var. angularis]|uniref:Uncharacterized protein n=1 Tax=Vigna angularis var. angularis TaxID=157739 RepID=A0A0S3SAF6_PHAAN|nr:hypothetical protein VIGAN_06082900 [Vigna angularis var. angularis]